MPKLDDCVVTFSVTGGIFSGGHLATRNSLAIERTNPWIGKSLHLCKTVPSLNHRRCGSHSRETLNGASPRRFAPADQRKGLG